MKIQDFKVILKKPTLNKTKPNTTNTDHVPKYNIPWGNVYRTKMQEKAIYKF